MTVQTPIRLSPAEDTLLAQLEKAGATDAATRLRGAGLPTRRVESYHYTDLKMLLQDVPPLAEAATGGAAEFAIAGAHRLPIVNGSPVLEGEAPEGVRATTVKGSTLTTRDDVLVRLNAAFVDTSLNLEISGTIADPIHIDRRMEGDAAHVESAAKIHVASGASATIIETVSGSDAAHMGNAASYVSLGDGAKLTHILVDLSAEAATHFASVEYRLEKNANLVSLVMHDGATLARTQVFAEFAGEGAHSDFLGLNLVDEGQHRDITLDITHAVPNTTSTEKFKQVGRGHGKAIFQGKIVVARDAQKTDAQMMTQGLMLAEDVEILSKPELEIFADDVVCAHGATCGDLDETWLFYLMSRGIPRVEAQTMLVRAFLEEVLDPIETESVATALNGVIEEWLAGAPMVSAE